MVRTAIPSGQPVEKCDDRAILRRVKTELQSLRPKRVADGTDGFYRFFWQNAYIANMGKSLSLTDNSEDGKYIMTDQLKTEISDDGIARLTLSQPGRRNAINADMWAALPIVLSALEAESPVALIVQGDGEHFAAGADISEFETLYSTAESAAQISADIQTAFDALAAFPMPTIASIRGACVGGGCGLALCCDIRMADSTARFAITPAKLGLVYPFSDIARLIDAVGVANAKDILLSARIIKAKPARKMGLIHQTHAVDELDDAVSDYAAALTRLSPESLRVTKSMIAAYQNGQRGETDETRAQFLAGFSSRDFGEGFRAFLEKRTPEF